MKTRILFTIPNFITAGSGGAMLNIVRRLDRDVFEPTICVNRTGGRLEREIDGLGIPLLETPFTVPAMPYATLLPRAWRAARVFRPHRFEIWHSFHYSDDYTEPIIARLAGARRWVFTKKNMNWKRRAWYLRTLLASRVAAQNRDMMTSFFGSPIFRYKTRLVPRGVDTARFRPGVEPRLQVRARLGLTGLVIGTVAHLVPVKGLEVLIEAVAARLRTTLLLAGKPLDAEYVAMLHARVAELGLGSRVHFLGDVEDVPAFLAELDIFCLPSLAEASPVALLEAMACGCTCIVSDIAGTRDLIDDGRTGWLVPTRDAAAWTSALAAGEAREARARIGLAARVEIEQRYSIEQEVAAHASLYREICRARE